MNTKKVYILSGPAGAGKNTLWDTARPSCDDRIEESVSMTTRDSRIGEVDGVHYHFISRERFLELIDQDAFLEYAHVHTNYYGSPKSELSRITDLGKSPIYIIDVQGALKLKPLLEKEGYTVVTIFLLPPSREEMERRIRGRGTETEDEFQVRLQSANREYDLKDQYDIHIVNDDLETAKNELLDIFYERK